MGPFPRVVGGYWFLYVAIDKFTKWPEATPVVKINKQSAVKFIKSIICRFGILNRIITDNESQFTSGAFQGYCEDLGIQICYASVAHLESNGPVERANTEILKGMKIHSYDGLKKHARSGLMSFRTRYGAIGHYLVEPRERRLSSWCTGMRLSFPQRSPWALYMLRHMMNAHRTSSGMRIST
jgi:transposase InsO family protein